MFVVIMLYSFTLFASAEMVSSEELYNGFDFVISDDVREVLESAGFEDFSAKKLSNISILDSFSAIFDVFKGSLKKPFSCLFFLTGIIILCSVGTGFVQQNKSISEYFDSVVILVIMLYSFLNVTDCISNAVIAMHSTGVMMKSLIPATAMLAAFSGNPSLAVSYNAVSMYCAEVISAVCRDFLGPVLYSFSAVSVCMSVNATTFNADYVLNAMKKVVGVVLGFCGTVYTGVLALKDVLAVGTDKIAVKSVKFVLGTTVPVIGSALSEGLSSVVASISLMKNVYGTIGIIVIITVTLPSVCEMILWILTFSLTEYISQALGLGNVAKSFSALKYVISMLLSILLFVVYILVVSSAMIMLLGNK